MYNRTLNRKQLVLTVQDLDHRLEVADIEIQQCCARMSGWIDRYTQTLEVLMGTGLAIEQSRIANPASTPYRMMSGNMVFGNLVLSPNLSINQRDRIESFVGVSYASAEVMKQELDELNEKKESLRQSLLETTVARALRVRGRSDKALVFVESVGTMVSQWDVNMYFNIHEGGDIIDLMRLPFFLQRFRLVSRDERGDSDVFYFRNISRKLSDQDVFNYAAKWLQENYDRGHPAVVAQREFLLNYMGMTRENPLTGREIHRNVAVETYDT
ncbi:hypothetical protein ACFL3V_00165 [Nanoarchaeota archaeon]